MAIKTLYFVGDQGCGKTTIIEGLLARLTQKKENPAAFKPFDTGLIKKNAQEQDLDSERFAAMMTGEPSANWITPYLANEDYPVEMALRRDGIKIDWRLVNSRHASLVEHYSHLLIEAPGGVATPLDPEHQVIDWLKKEQAEVVLVISPDKGALEGSLLAVESLEQSGLNYHLLLNNRSPLQDGDLVFYQWEKLEGASNRQVIGMMPTLKSVNPERVAEALVENGPKLMDRLSVT